LLTTYIKIQITKLNRACAKGSYNPHAPQKMVLSVCNEVRLAGPLTHKQYSINKLHSHVEIGPPISRGHL